MPSSATQPPSSSTVTQLLERIEKRLARKPSSGTHALAYIKVDKFKDVVGKVGILNSDEILGQFAEAVRKRLASA